MKGGIASRLAIIFSLLVLVSTATVGFLVFWGARQSLIQSSAERLAHTAETIEVRFFASLEAIRKDVLFLSETPPVPGIMRARADRGLMDTQMYMTDQEWREQLAQIFTVFLQNRPSYFQIRFIGLEQGGLELVRVERRDGKIHWVPRSELQQRGDRTYFRETIGLPPGTVYLSEIEPDRQEGELQSPEGPVMLAAVPVYDAGNRPFGILVINVDCSEVLRALEGLTGSDVSLYLANSEGKLLLRPQSPPAESTTAEPLASMAGTPFIQDVFPGIEPLFDKAAGATVPHRISFDRGAPHLSYFERIAYYGGSESDQHSLFLGITSPRASILAGVTQVRNRSAIITLLLCLGGIFLALVFSRYLTRPLRQITQAVARFGEDQQAEISLPVRRKDEFGVLARTYDKMVRQIEAQIKDLEDQARRQRIILETSAEAIIVTDASGSIEIINKAAERIFGYKDEEVIGQNIARLVPAAASGSDGAGGWAALGNEREVTGRRKDGTLFPLSLALSSFSLAGELKFAGFLQDITEQKRYEETLRQAKLSAEAANRAKSAFLANMSHEIRTPLTGIIGFASLLAKQVSGKHRKYARLIESSGERLKETLNSVLDLAKLEANRMEMNLDVLDVGREVQEVVQLFQSQARQKSLSLEFVMHAEAEQAQARLDRGALSSILHNLIGNAIKFTDEGGIVVDVDADDQFVYVSVQDTGVGIDPSFMPYLFDAFRQESTGMSRTHEGSGLGLSITKRLVELMDGRIEVESIKGQGSTFTVSFPRERTVVVSTPKARLDPEESLPENGTKGVRVLLVEDNRNTQYLIESLLDEGYDITVASSAEEALLRAFNTDFDMILLDINLGEGANGIDVLRELRKMPSYQEVPIAAITAYALPGDRERFLEMGFSAYLSKPFNADELLRLASKLQQGPGESNGHARSSTLN